MRQLCFDIKTKEDVGMKRIENDCVGCDYCVHCGRDKVLYIYCDVCNDTDDKIYNFDGKDYCYQCLVKELISHYSDEISTEWFDDIRDSYDIREVEYDD